MRFSTPYRIFYNCTDNPTEQEGNFLTGSGTISWSKRMGKKRSFVLSVLIILAGVDLSLGKAWASEPSDSAADPSSPAEPIGLELWLSGEEPVESQVIPQPPAPHSLSDSNSSNSNASDSNPFGEAVEIIPNGSDRGTDSGSDSSVESPAPSIVPDPLSSDAPLVIFSERSTGCGVTVTERSATPSGHCQDPQSLAIALGQQLSQQWNAFNGTIAADSDFSPEERSPFQVAVQALGSAMQSSSAIQDYYFQTQRPAPLTSKNDRGMLFPLRGWAPITSAFGWRTHPLSQDRRLHTGTDLGALWGTPVVAAFSGEVQVADWVGGYGVTVLLNHADQDRQTLYGHLSEIFVQPGEWVKQGEVIGRVGSTGNSTGPHLHFELRQWDSDGWVAIDAGSWLVAAMRGEETPIHPDLAWSLPSPPSLPSTAGLDFRPRNPLERWIGWLLTFLTQTV